MAADSPDLVIAKRLLDHAKAQGFQFQRVAEGPDGALLGIRRTGEWTDTQVPKPDTPSPREPKPGKRGK
jgi:hypothetical protein